MINYDVPLDKRGQNANIKGHILDEETMQKHKFKQREYRGKKWWYRGKNLGRDISMNITLEEDKIQIDFLDDAFCQPYDYQEMLRKNPSNEFCLEIHKQAQEIMLELSHAGIISGYQTCHYI